MVKKAVLWPYRYADMMETWARQMCWVATALQRQGVEVKRHPDFKCKELEKLPPYDHKTDNPCDLAIYNHSDDSELVGNVIKSERNWHFKPVGPTPMHTALDSLGYGPFSDIAFNRPDFEAFSADEVKLFFDTQVAEWISSRSTKWGNRFENFALTCPEKDYHLVIGQCGGDSVVTHHDFGNYWSKLTAVVRELVRVDKKRLVVVKLHPYTDGQNAKDNGFSQKIAVDLGAIDPRVKVYTGKSNIHAFIPGARDVFLANSGAGFEAMMHKKPIIAWGYPEYHWVTYDLRLLASIRHALTLEWWSEPLESQFLMWYFTRYAFCTEEGAARRVKDLLAVKE